MIIGLDAFLGGRLITSLSTGSTPRLVLKIRINWKRGVLGSVTYPTFLKHGPRDLSKNDVKLIGGVGGVVYCINTVRAFPRICECLKDVVQKFFWGLHTRPPCIVAALGTPLTGLDYMVK